jgi:hypothetical protein
MYFLAERDCARLTTPFPRQKVVQNKGDYEAIRNKLEAIVSMAEKYKQHGSQRALDRRVEDLSRSVIPLRIIRVFLQWNSFVHQCCEASHGQDPTSTRALAS